jgi:deoxyribodipyrimidine photolyase
VALARLGEFVDTHVATHADKRSQLDLDETSRLSTHLHFGEISPNQVWYAVTRAPSSAGAALDRIYPLPIVDHAKARARALAAFAKLRKG